MYKGVDGTWGPGQSCGAGPGPSGGCTGVWMAPGPQAEGWSAGPGPSGGCTVPWMAPGPWAESCGAGPGPFLHELGHLG